MSKGEAAMPDDPGLGRHEEPVSSPREPTGPVRLCPACGAPEEIRVGDPIWPSGHACPGCGRALPSEDGVPLLAPELADTITGFDPASFSSLETMEEGHFWFEPRNRLLGELLVRHFPHADDVLELGCGTGFVLDEIARRLKPKRLIGSELHPRGLAIARRRLGGKAAYVQMDARRIEARAAFDVIGAFDVLEHIDEDEDVIRAMHGALRPGGGVLVAVPQHPALWSGADEVACHARRYRRGELERKLGRNGFRVIFSGSYCALTLPLMVASRWGERVRRRGRGAAQASEIEARPGKVLNACLRALLDLEVATTLAGLRYPAGGSRVVAAMRDG